MKVLGFYVYAADLFVALQSFSCWSNLHHPPQSCFWWNLAPKEKNSLEEAVKHFRTFTVKKVRPDVQVLTSEAAPEKHTYYRIDLSREFSESTFI